MTSPERLYKILSLVLGVLAVLFIVMFGLAMAGVVTSSKVRKRLACGAVNDKLETPARTQTETETQAQAHTPTHTPPRIPIKIQTETRTRTETETPFLWGGASSAFQTEGNLTAGGRGPSIWDGFVKNPDKVGSPDLASNSYYQFPQDVAVLKSVNATAYRLSIAWPRVLPKGVDDGTDFTRNPEGIQHYRRVFSALRDAGIEPVVTLYHWDLPQALEDAYGGWLGTDAYPGQPHPKIVTDFVKYVLVCLEVFGDLVTHWVTIHEPQSLAVGGYEYPLLAPGTGTSDGDSPEGHEYTVGHNLLLAHGAAYRAFKSHPAGQRPGAVMSIEVNMEWAGGDGTIGDDAAAHRANVFSGAWFWDPLFFGEYPTEMRDRVGGRLPHFTPDQRASVHGALDLVMWSTVCTRHVHTGDDPDPHGKPKVGWAHDQRVTVTAVDTEFGDGVAWIQGRYSGAHPETRTQPSTAISVHVPGQPPRSLGLMVTGHGVQTPPGVQDTARSTFIKAFFGEVVAATRKHGVPFLGFVPCSLLDSFEWTRGVLDRYGLTHLDYSEKDGALIPAGGQAVTLTRVPKKSLFVLREVVDQYLRAP